MGQGVDVLGTLLRIVPERAAPPINDARLRRVLIVKLSSIGDVVHALPVATALKRRYPEMHLTWAVESAAAPLLCGHAAIDRVVVFPSAAEWSRPGQGLRACRRAVAALREDAYDVIVDLQGLARSAVVAGAARGGRRLARRGQREGAHLVSRAVPIPADAHAIDEYLAIAAHLGAATRPVVFALSPSAAAVHSVRDRLAAEGVGADRPVIAVNPSAAQRAKAWPDARWCEVVDALAGAGTVVLVGGTASAARHEGIAASCRRPVLDWSGTTTLPELVALLHRATLHVAPDTGTLHIAAALGTRVVGVYGPSSPERVGPWAQRDGVVHHRNRCGRGCPAYCRFGRRCLDAVSAAEVIERATAMLAAANAPVRSGCETP